MRKKSKYTLDESVLDHKLRQKLWEGLIPLKIDLDLNDIKSSQKPRSLYIMAPRENYFFVIIDNVKALFDQYAPQDKLEAYDEMYFEFNRQPLKWNIPIGVQFDSAVGLSGKKEEIPWCLIFHYRNNPVTQYFTSGHKTYHFNFMNSLKESLFLRMGDANEILGNLSKKDEQKMVNEGLLKNNYTAFWEINQDF